MGIIGAIKSGANSLKSGAESAFNSAKGALSKAKNSFTTNYRTGVLNDFSIVTKAVFHILTYDQTLNSGYGIFKSLPVQINPEHLNHAITKPVNGQDLISGRKQNAIELSFTDSVDIRLIFDIYDDYVAGGEILGKSISLYNKDYTALPELIEYNTSKRYASNFKTLFKWGEIKYFGVMSGISVEYTAFSRWGNPLKAEATVSMSLENDNLIGSIIDEADAYSRVSDVLNKATLVGLTGAKEIGGIALGVVQSLRD